MIGRSIWGQAKKEFGKIDDQKIKDEMITEFKPIMEIILLTKVLLLMV